MKTILSRVRLKRATSVWRLTAYEENTANSLREENTKNEGHHDTQTDTSSTFSKRKWERFGGYKA